MNLEMLIYYLIMDRLLAARFHKPTFDPTKVTSGGSPSAGSKNFQNCVGFLQHSSDIQHILLA